MRLLRLISGSLVFLLVITSCQNKINDVEKQNIEEIISLTINRLSFPLPPPPNFIGDSIKNSVINQKTRDSLNAIKMKIALYPNIEGSTLSILLEDEIDINSINNLSQHEIIFADTIILKKSRDWKEYDLLFMFSDISFNKKFSRAKASIGVSRSALWGQGYDINYKKEENGKWTIERSILKEKW